MLSNHYVFEMCVRERQEILLAEARQDRRAAAAHPRKAAGQRTLFAPVLEMLGQLLIDAGESLRRAAG
jgi:hypothetical protein